MDLITAEWILGAIKIVESGKFNALEGFGVRVYRHDKNTIRVDVKTK